MHEGATCFEGDLLSDKGNLCLMWTEAERAHEGFAGFVVEAFW